MPVIWLSKYFDILINAKTGQFTHKSTSITVTQAGAKPLIKRTSSDNSNLNFLYCQTYPKRNILYLIDYVRTKHSYLIQIVKFRKTAI